MLDLIIKNARVVDGTGNPWYYAELGLMNEEIVTISRTPIPGEAKKTIDAQGMVIAPGFIDIHSHADLAVLRDPECLGRLRQGVTTQVIGNCGLSVTPVSRKSSELLKGPFEASLGSYPDWKWSNVSEYFEHLTRNPIGNNVALLMGHATFRTTAMNGVENRVPTDDELQTMRRLVTEGIEQGAFGISTGMIYPPSCYANSTELIEIAKTVARSGGIYTSHIRGEGRTLIPAIQEVIEIAEKAKIPAQISHLKANNPLCWGKVNEALELIENARRRGLDISCDQYPYIAGSGSLTALIPPWVQEGGTDQMVERFKDPGVRRRIKAEFDMEDLPSWDNYAKPTGWANFIITWSKSARNKDLEGLSIAAIAEQKGKEPWDVIGDLLIEEHGAVQMIGFIMSEEDVQTVMRYPGTMIGSDGIESGEKPHPRLYGTFPRILERYVRELKVLTLEDAVRKMTSLTAARLGLTDRGVIKIGMKADLIIFDPERVEERATFNDPHLEPVGIEYVIVNGGVSMERGKPTQQFFGQALKRK